MPALTQRNKQHRKFRSILLETLEQRSLFAADLLNNEWQPTKTAPISDLGQTEEPKQRLLNVKESLSVGNEYRFGTASKFSTLIAEAQRLEQELNYAEAFRKYSKARDVDPSSKVALEGMSRTRAYLKDRSKQLYTEGVLAESYSDFSVARSRFEQLLSLAPPDDPYYERAKRKLSRYVTPEDAPQ